ncbi:CobW/HypB/UreG, nucleotide-binding domain-containing protein [Pavlovales sp. CCMP2436]|nr:CobW/HypB/UreG, nucleotide-binding domain-containing protein [Pavlovales sp. CCMP2436]
MNRRSPPTAVATAALPCATISAAVIAAKVPVVLVSGFLGAGKTTLVAHTLANRQGRLLGFVVNDVAAVNIDASLLVDASAAEGEDDRDELHMVTLEDGCICCERSGELLPCVEKLLLSKAQSADPRPFDAIIIECTGLAEPNRLRTAFENPLSPFAHVLDQVELTSVVTVVDAAAFQAHYESLARYWGGPL